MNKADLIAKLAPKLNITQDEARIVLNSVLEVITEALVEDKNVRLVDFGTFEVKQRAERMGHNPKTGEKLKIEAKKIVTFKQGKALGEQFIVKPKQKSKAKKESLIFLSSLFSCSALYSGISSFKTFWIFSLSSICKLSR